ncbi:MAG: hypothetical protein ACO3U0_01905 [Ilumatobacteraceae bacterium]
MAATAVAMMTISACGSTYVDDELLAESAAATSTTTAPPADTATSTPASTVAGDVAAAVTELRSLLDALSDAVVDDDADAAALLTNVDQLWAEIEPTLRADHPEALFPMEQAVLLATTSVERRRPADASKGALILRDLAATLIN